MNLQIVRTLRSIIFSLVACSFASNVSALQVHVTDTKGKNLENAVVMVLTNNGKTLSPSKINKTAIDQRDKEFIPYVTALPVGSSVVFPNNDNIRHQVYSFSDAKNFEIPLYKGNPERPVSFEKEGIVALGCNIHDWMKAYIVVSPTPYYVVTDSDGKATLSDLPLGELGVQVWHPSLKGSTNSTAQVIQYQSADQTALSLSIPTKRVWRAFRSPNNAGSGGYR